MNKKGFTLVELLAVIVLLAIITTIAVTSMSAIHNNSLKKLLETKIEQIESAAIIYGQENPNELTEKNCVVDGVTYSFCKTVKVGDLIAGNFFESGVFEGNDRVLINDVTKKNMNEDTVQIYRKNNRIYAVMKEIKSNS